MDTEIDYYELLEIGYSATDKEIRKAFRIKSLSCHPDKVSPNDKKAAEIFYLINIAVETLTDPVKRVKYDNLHKAKRLHKERMEKMDKERRFDKDKLFERESQALKRKQDFSQEENEKIEINKARERNIQRMKARQEMKRQEITSNLSGIIRKKELEAKISEASPMDCSIKIKFKRELSIDEVRLRNSFSRYGEIEKIILKDKSGIIVYKTLYSCYDCIHAKEYPPDLKPFKISTLETEPKGFEHIRMLKDENGIGMLFQREGSLNRGKEYEDETLKKLNDLEQKKS
jgi:hypothetical protein